MSDVTKAKGWLISKCCLQFSTKNRMNTIRLEVPYLVKSNFFRSFFGRIEDTKEIFRNQLTLDPDFFKNNLRFERNLFSIFHPSPKIRVSCLRVKFRFSEKATKFFKNLPLVLMLLGKNGCFVATSGRFFSNFVAFSQCLDFTTEQCT